MLSPSPVPHHPAGSSMSAKVAANATAETVGVNTPAGASSAPTSTAPIKRPLAKSNTPRGKKPAPLRAPHPSAPAFEREISPQLQAKLHELAALLYQNGVLEIECVVNSFVVVSTSGNESFELDAGHWLMVRVPGYYDLTQPARLQFKQE